ncbi:MAG: HAD family hydrolase, partial [Candidatus Hodarchaeales archaeon]
MKNNEIALIFDVDGTLIDVKNSYIQTILLTSYIYAKKVLGFQKLPLIDKWFTVTHVNDLKRIKGFNNDFTCTSALLLFFMELFKPLKKAYQTIPLLSEDSLIATISNINSFNEEWKEFLSNFLRKPELPPELIIKERDYSFYLKHPGAIENGNYLERIFQEVYYGKSKFEKFYKTDPLFSKKETGLYEKESLLIPFKILDHLKMTETPLAIFTGRPKFDVELIFDHFSLNKYFDQKFIISLTDCLKEEKIRKDGEILSKPNPWGINQLKKLLPVCKRYVMIGDSEDDILSAYNAKITSILFKNDDLDI